jgi:hypothetical protein
MPTRSKGIGPTATVIQPSPPVPGEPPARPPVPAGLAGLEDFWPRHELTRKTRRQHNRDVRYDRAGQLADGIFGHGRLATTATEAQLYHYLAQCPEAFLLYSQVLFSFLRLDFCCPFASYVSRSTVPNIRGPTGKNATSGGTQSSAIAGSGPTGSATCVSTPTRARRPRRLSRSSAGGAGFLPPSDSGSSYSGFETDQAALDSGHD